MSSTDARDTEPALGTPCQARFDQRQEWQQLRDRRERIEARHAAYPAHVRRGQHDEHDDERDAPSGSAERRHEREQ